MEFVTKRNYSKNRSILKIIFGIILLIILVTLLIFIIQKGKRDKIPENGTLVQSTDVLITEDLSYWTKYYIQTRSTKNM